MASLLLIGKRTMLTKELRKQIENILDTKFLLQCGKCGRTKTCTVYTELNDTIKKALKKELANQGYNAYFVATRSHRNSVLFNNNVHISGAINECVRQRAISFYNKVKKKGVLRID